MPRDVLVLRALHLGDLLRAVPAFRAMRTSWPDARIRLIGLPWSHALVARLPGYLDDALDFPGWPGIPECPFDAVRTSAFVEGARAAPADLAVQLHGSGRHTNTFVALLAARRMAGTFVPGDPCPDPETFVVHDESLSEVRRCLAVLARVGVRPAGEHLELRVLGDDERAAEAALEDVGAPPADRDGFGIVHAGGRSSRRWPAGRFAVVADALAREMPVVLTGTPDERAVADEVVARMSGRAIDLVGRTSLGALFALVRRARVVVCNDSGISHVADALGVPSVVLYTTSRPARWAPVDTRLHRVVRADAAVAADVISEALELVSSPSGSAR
jgi:ADP-heptose:LPS heptosyltransferase